MTFKFGDELTIKANVKVTGIYPAGDVRRTETGIRVDFKGFEAVIPESILEGIILTEDTEQAEPDFEAMTIAQLKEYASEKNIDLGNITKKAEIINKIKGAEDGEN